MPTDPSSILPVPLISVLGWIPAVIFPGATLLQLAVIVRRKTAEGVSVIAWSAYAVANASLFLYTEKYGELESILGALGTAVLNLCIVAAALRYRKPRAGNPKVSEAVP